MTYCDILLLPLHPLGGRKTWAVSRVNPGQKGWKRDRTGGQGVEHYA